MNSWWLGGDGTKMSNVTFRIMHQTCMILMFCNINNPGIYVLATVQVYFQIVEWQSRRN